MRYFEQAEKIVLIFSDKIKKGVQGRSETFAILESKINSNDKTLWFHCASLGEYEQGLPVFEALKEKYLDFKIVLSFFSPSGYEIRKNADIADIVVYLPQEMLFNKIMQSKEQKENYVNNYMKRAIK